MFLDWDVCMCLLCPYRSGRMGVRGGGGVMLWMQNWSSWFNRLDALHPEATVKLLKVAEKLK